MTLSTWGFGPWGSIPWGLGMSGSPASVDLQSAIAVRENVVRPFFTAELGFTGLLGPDDAGDPDHYIVSPVAGTVGSDSLPCRPVLVLLAEDVDDQGHPGTVVDLTVDRPFSPYPAQYLVTVNNLVSLDSGILNPSNASATFFGSFMPAPDLQVDGSLPTRDIAHPDTLTAQLDPLPDAGNELVLGTIPVDASGDYGIDEGIVSLTKRVFRRVLTARDRFLHARGYGAGASTFLKLLARASTRQAFASEAEAQLRQEPDVAAARVRVVSDDLQPDLGRFTILVRPKVGRPVKLDVPFRAV